MKKLLIALVLCLLPTLAFAQSQRNPCFYPQANPENPGGCIPVSTDNPLPVTGGGSGGGTVNQGTPNAGGVNAWTVTDAGVLAAVQGPIPAGTFNIGNTGSISQYPNGSTPITASATGTTAATTATLAASAGVKTYICGFSIRANATAAATANSTVTGTITGTLNYTQWTAPAASGIGLTEQIFSPCIPSSAVNTGIAVISSAPGTGGVVSVSAWGYQL